MNERHSFFNSKNELLMLKFEENKEMLFCEMISFFFCIELKATTVPIKQLVDFVVFKIEMFIVVVVVTR